jgi:DNA-binding GntR family transcriptional regulator
MIENLKCNIEKRSLAEQVYRHIKRMILSGELQAGVRVPEERIAGEFGVSRTPIREALHRLAVLGLITIKPRSYAEVVKINTEEADQIAVVRGQLEILAVRLLAEKAGEDDCQALRRSAKECIELLAQGDVAGFFEKDSEFHLEIARRSGNRYLAELMEQLDPKVQLFRLARCTTTKKIKANAMFHDKIVEAICRNDVSGAAKLIEQHVWGIGQ